VANYNGTDSFTFRVFDGTAYSNTETMNFTITPVADTPVVVSDIINVTSGLSRVYPLLNDTDADILYQADVLSVAGFTQTLSGTLVLSGTGFEYTPPLGFSGTEIFDYSVRDLAGNLSNTGTVTLVINPNNTIPIASPLVFSGTEDMDTVGTLSGSDLETSSLTYILDILPQHGIVTLGSAGIFIYTPGANSNGADFFTYHVSDGVFNSPSVRVDLYVTAVNDAPIALNDMV
jgi:hypothetical protein